MSEDLIEEIILDQALPSSAKASLNYTQKLYLYWLPKVNLNKQNAYQKSHPESSADASLKNASRFDRTVRTKCPLGYQMVIDHFNKNQPTEEEIKFKQAVVEHPTANKTEIMELVRPDLSKNSMIQAYNRINKSLTVKDPDWRAKLAENYDIDGAFERMADMSRGKAKTFVEQMNPETGAIEEVERLIPVSPETQRKTIMDMLAFTGMRPEETALDMSRQEAREKHGNVINQILNITIYESDK